MIVVESFVDTIAVHQAGYPVVGLMGSTLSRHQADLLTASFDRVLVTPDGDEARHGATAIASALAGRTAVTLVSIEGRQPDQLAPANSQGLFRAHLERHEPLSTPSSMMERQTCVRLGDWRDSTDEGREP